MIFVQSVFCTGQEKECVSYGTIKVGFCDSF